MKTGAIFFFGGIVLTALGALFGAVFLSALVTSKNGAFSNLLAVLVLGAAPVAAGLGLLRAGVRRTRIERESEERGFADLATSLASGHGGQVRLDEICRASGITSEEAQAKMRALTGRGLFDLDFDANGQMVYRLSPDAGRAQLAQMTGRS